MSVFNFEDMTMDSHSTMPASFEEVGWSDVDAFDNDDFSNSFSTLLASGDLYSGDGDSFFSAAVAESNFTVPHSNSILEEVLRGTNSWDSMDDFVDLTNLGHMGFPLKQEAEIYEEILHETKAIESPHGSSTLDEFLVTSPATSHLRYTNVDNPVSPMSEISSASSEIPNVPACPMIDFHLAGSTDLHFGQTNKGIVYATQSNHNVAKVPASVVDGKILIPAESLTKITSRGSGNGVTIHLLCQNANGQPMTVVLPGAMAPANPLNSESEKATTSRKILTEPPSTLTKLSTIRIDGSLHNSSEVASSDEMSVAPNDNLFENLRMNSGLQDREDEDILQKKTTRRKPQEFPAHLRMNQKARKQFQNREAATRYRIRKKLKGAQHENGVDQLEELNQVLKASVFEKEKEIRYLKDFLRELRSAV